MVYKIVFFVFLFVVFCYVQVNAQRGRACKTPNQEWAICTPIKSCGILLNTIFQNPNAEQHKFLLQSKCGHDSEYLVCCGSKNSYVKMNYLKSIGAVEVKAKGGATNRNFTINSNLPRRPACGQDFSEKIYGGKETKINEIPWMALLQYENSTGYRTWACAGNLINNRYILTAAHCVTGYVSKIYGRLVNVRLGEYDTKHEIDCDGILCNNPEDIGIEEVFYHKNYNSEDINQYHDIALIRLNRPVTYSSFIQPICLPYINETAAVGDRLIVAGWGSTENLNKSPKKLKVKIPIAQRKQCTAMYSQNRQKISLIESQICAGGLKGKDSCGGDSGGPLMKTVVGDVSTWYLEGIVSFGSKWCGIEGWPGIYTSVEKYLGWIHSNVKN